MPFRFEPPPTAEEAIKRLCTLFTQTNASGHIIEPDHKQVRELIQIARSANYTVDGSGHTMLHIACNNGWLGMVKLLLAENANPDYCDNWNNTALHAACDSINHPARQEILELLLAHRPKPNPNAVNNGNETPLLHACQSSCSHMVRLLLEAGADPNLGNPEHRYYPINPFNRYGTLGEDITMVQLLLAHGANPNVTNRKGETLFTRVIDNLGNSQLNRQIIDTLFEAGAKLPPSGRPFTDPAAAQIMASMRSTAQMNWDTCFQNQPINPTRITRHEVINAARLGRHLELFALPQWHDHLDHLHQLLPSLPAWIQQDIFIHHPNLLLTDTSPSLRVQHATAAPLHRPSPSR